MFAKRNAVEAARFQSEYEHGLADVEARTTFDEMARLDLALVKRMAAGEYVRKRHALRRLVKLGVFSPAEARRMTWVLQELRAKWIAARSLLRGA